MIIGIAIPSFIALIGGLLTYLYMNDVKTRQGFVQIADDLKEQVLEVRRNEKNFLLHKEAGYYKYLQDAITVLGSSIDNISQKTILEIGENDLLQLRKSIQTYTDLINKLYEHYQEETNVIEEVREEGRKLETFIASGKHAKELSSDFILNLRRLEKNYMLFRDKISLNKLRDALSKLKNITPFCFECNQYIGAVQNLFSSYEKSDLIINELQLIGSKIEEITNKTASSERQKVNSFIVLIQRYLLLVLVLLCTLGPFLVYKTTAYIVAPIKRLVEITRKISEGDLTQRAPIKEHDETFFLAQSFNTMLDHLQLTHESLEKSLELLREKQDKLVESEKLASLGTLASGVAHELNNPLNNIYLASQTLSREIDPENTPEIVKECVRDISSQTLRVKRIVSDLLEFARAKGPELSRINIGSVIKGVLEQMTSSGEMSNIKFNLKSHDDIEILGDKILLEQVFINLFSNAADAMDGNGALDIVIYKMAASVKIRISDTGKGIPPENMSKIFDPFFTTKEKGTGLGLAIVYSIIKKHKGEIEVKSEPDKGTTFTIMLPR